MTERPGFGMGAPTAGGDGATHVAVHIPPDLRYLEGHFPGDPIVPGIAQLLLVESAVRRAWPELGSPRRVSRLKFTRALGPDDRLDVRLVRDDATVRFLIVRGADECSRGTLRFGAGG